MQNRNDISPDWVNDRAADMVNELLKALPMKKLATVTGLSASMLDKIKNKRTGIGGVTLMKLLVASPPEIATLMLVGTDKHVCANDPEATNWFGLLIESNRLSEEIAEALSDGQVDHVEEARLQPRLRSMRSKTSARITEAA